VTVNRNSKIGRFCPDLAGFIVEIGQFLVNGERKTSSGCGPASRRAAYFSLLNLCILAEV
jgi:hypothetical protein